MIAIERPGDVPKVSMTTSVSQPVTTNATAAAILPSRLLTSPACGGGRSASSDAMRVGALSTWAVRLVETPPPQPSLASGRGGAPSSRMQSIIIEVLKARTFVGQRTLDLDQLVDPSLQTGPAKAGFCVEIERKEFRRVRYVELGRRGRDHGDEDVA